MLLFVNYFSGLKHQNLIFRVNYNSKTKGQLASWPRPKKLPGSQSGRRIRPWSNQKFRYLRPGSTYRKFTVSVIISM